MADTATNGYTPHLKAVYNDKVVAELNEKFKYTNQHEVPTIEKVVINMGVGEGARDAKVIDLAEADLNAIAGQKCIRTKARRSIAAFKLREGMAIGVAVTLRKERMWDFLHRLIYVALPRVRDFRGVSAKGFDGRGNYTMGVREHIIFTEIDISKAAKNFGMNISVVTSAKTDEEARALLASLGMPFRK